MIISTACKEELLDFKNLMEKTDRLLNADAHRREDYYVTRGGKKLEEDVFCALQECAKGTAFEGTVKLVSGASFPDIVAKRMFGVEVKSTEKNHWQSLGSSILESTRDQNVERIFITFGKLGKPVEFLSKPYEDCLSEIVVTHYPRYKIDMKLQEKNLETIFQKMDVDYDELRLMDNPVPLVSQYYKRNLKPGESLWWAADESESSTPMKACLWSTLSSEQREQLLVEGYVLFPEVLGPSNRTKYNRYALWLATKKGIINTNIRDGFSAGGKVLMKTASGLSVKMPAVFGRIKMHKEFIRNVITEIEANTLAEYWGCEIERDRIGQWCNIVAEKVDATLGSDLVLDVLSEIFSETEGENYKGTSLVREPVSMYVKYIPRTGHYIIDNENDRKGVLDKIHMGYMRVIYEDGIVAEYSYPEDFLNHRLTLLPNIKRR